MSKKFDMIQRTMGVLRFPGFLRWPTTVTSKQNAHIKFKSRTSNSNHSQQIQIAHSKLQIHHSKLQIVHIKYKSLTANTNRSQQIQIAHSKYKYGQCKGRTADCGLRTADQGKKQTEGKM